MTVIAFVLALIGILVGGTALFAVYRLGMVVMDHLDLHRQHDERGDA